MSVSMLLGPFLLLSFCFSIAPSLRLSLCQPALEQIAHLQPQLRRLFDVFTRRNVSLRDYMLFVSLYQSAKQRSHLLATKLRVCVPTSCHAASHMLQWVCDHIVANTCSLILNAHDLYISFIVACFGFPSLSRFPELV